MFALGFVNLVSYCFNNTEQLDKIKSIKIKQEEKDRKNVKYGIEIDYISGKNEYISFVLIKKNILFNSIYCKLYMFLFIDPDGSIYADNITESIKFYFLKNTIKLTLKYIDNKTLEDYERIIIWKNKTINDVRPNFA